MYKCHTNACLPLFTNIIEIFRGSHDQMNVLKQDRPLSLLDIANIKQDKTVRQKYSKLIVPKTVHSVLRLLLLLGILV